MTTRIVGAMLIAAGFFCVAACGQDVPLGSGQASSADAASDGPLDWAIGGVPPNCQEQPTLPVCGDAAAGAIETMP